MKNKDVKSSLRQRAEELARNLKAQSPQNLDAYPFADIQKMFHELQVHQIELELQNEELHQTQVELENARLHYFDLYDKAPVGYITVSDEGLIQQSNDTAAVLLGAERAFLDEQSMAGFILKEDQAIFHRQCRQILETGAPQESEVRVTKKDGSIFWAHLVMNATPEHARLYRVAICNITAQKLSEEALRLQVEERFCSLLNDMPDGFAHCRMVYDDQGHPADFLYLNVNKAFERLTGLKNVVGKPVTEVIPNIKELNPELFELYGKVVSTGKPEKFEIFFRPMEKWLDVSVTQSGEGCFAVIFEDITDRKRAEEALRRTDALLNSVIENTPNSLWFSDEHGTLLRLNQACRDILCLRDHEVVGKYNILKDPMLESQGLMPCNAAKYSVSVGAER
jgi:PAS domain S-box-containing protein